MAKKKFPKKLIVIETDDLGDYPILICHETPEEIPEEYADEPVAIYELVAYGKFSVEKQVDAKLVKKK